MRTRTFSAWIAAIGAWASIQPAVLACPVCFRIDDGPTTAGVRAAVFVLVGVTAAVLSGFGVFVARFLKRTRAATHVESGRRS